MSNGNETKSSSPRLDFELLRGALMSPAAEGSAGGGGPFFSSTSDQMAYLSNILQKSFHNTALRASGFASGKALFTASQWQELERQKMIHSYILASMPVPPQLLLPASSFSQCNTSGLDTRCSANGSDPEPWRCKRTDGKKWRCSRDVAADQKYCERHAHKNRPRSRKLVEVSSPHKPLKSSTCQLSAPTSPASNDQTRCIEWFKNSVSTRGQRQLEQATKISSSSTRRVGLNIDNTDPDKNMPVYRPHFDDNPYIPDTSGLHQPYPMKSLQGTQTTRHFFFDAWGKEGLDASLNNKFPVSPSSSSRLSLSMSGGNNDNELGNLGVDMMDDGILKPHQWMNSPLGEALCLGNANTTRGGSGFESPRGCSNSNTTTAPTNSSSCTKSSGEEGSHALHFIG